ncbi:nuclear pore complex protein Nup154 [Megachile rotundata]|uniref:nuclear pore complex protein Nup154 n=1 Tax=Megachile rotundata TaxID=143995 RepID=UPI000614DCAE|nr:PREDICTED: nuclear pore complex protein Nup155 [Megachile rotundata]XP_012137925.1 PREDICTED: nuclear pore complex protein Nup155 [Megachile rotundata]XP_012137926.1 PREDICTED: nuclear pore complex protein Nup155 [Megachile rotundata]
MTLTEMEPLKIHLDALEMAGKVVDTHITADSNFPSLINLMRYNVQGGPTVSGLDSHDYPNVNGMSKCFLNMNQMKAHSKISLPSEIMEHFHHMQCHCMMGLFTEISKAWLTIDSDIYVWSYENESDVAYFDGLNETIISVGLVKPKSGVFQSYVKYLLILTTTVEITILGVMLTETTEGAPPEMQLVPEPIFTVTTDGIGITTIANTNSGRIFLGGRNGSLYEIYYQAESSWFGKRCKKINHSEGPLSFLVPSFVTIALSEEEAIIQISVDDTRNILYTLGDKGTIAVWDIDNEGASKIASLSQASLVQNAVHVVKTLDSNNFRPLVSISAITESESVHLNLVVVAATGTRFYFSCTSVTNPTTRPQGLQLIHVRLPPGYAANATVMRPRKVQMAHYRKGTLILVCGGDTETALCLSNDAYPFTTYLAETQSPLLLDSPVWAMAEILVEPAIRIEKQSTSQGEPPLIVRQHMEAPRKFIFLTSQGAIIFVQVRPMDILKQLLLEQRGPDTEAVRAYFQSQTLEQACATCLILATLESSQNAELAEWATRAFFLYGSQPTTNIGPAIDLHNINAGDMRTSTPRVPNYDSRLQGFRPHAPLGLNTDISLQQFSAKHNGLYLYVGRILRPIWNMRCIKQEVINNKTQISSTISTRQVSWILGLLQALRSFLNKNTHITKQHGTTRSISDGFETTMGSHYQEPIVEERNSLAALKIFIIHACEVLELWRILCENNLNNIVNCLSKDQVNQFSTATFRDLILIGHEISSLLIIHLIDSYLGDNASIDIISQRLREVCPNLYRSEDAVCSKANEIILKAKSCTNPEEKECYLQSALKLCKEVAPILNLSAVCQQFVACQFYSGVLELCLCCAERVDHNNAALHYYKNNEPIEDQEGRFAYMKRTEIYKEFITLLDHLYNQSISNPLTPSIPSRPGPPPQNASTAPVTPAKEILHKMINDALHSSCEILHTSVYTWMIDRGLHGELVAFAAPSLEAYLTRFDAPNLLWQFYEKNKNHAAAAKILDSLATKESNIPLSQRVEYLTRAVVCMRSDQAGYAPYLGIFLRELEDKVEVARIQQQILETIYNQHLHDRLSEDALKALKFSLLDITKLYEKYADPLQLWECKLSIIHCSGHQDAMLIQEIWTNIINNELKASTASNADDKMAILTSKIISLGQEYSGSPHCFPVDFLIKQLEIKACNLNVLNTGIISGFLQLGVSMEDLLDIYKMIGKDTRTWLNEGNEFHLIESTANLVNYFISHSNVTNNFIRRKIITKCQDVISKCLTTLYSKPHGQELITKLRSIQSVLNRM